MNYKKYYIQSNLTEYILGAIFFLLFPVRSHAQNNLNIDNSVNNAFFITPNISTSETWSDNLNLTSGIKESGWISSISPGLSVRSKSGRANLNINYSLNYLNYSSGGDRNSLQNNLNSTAVFELMDGRAFIDINGVVSQQTISALSIQNDGFNPSLNKSEVSSYSLSPYYRGRASDFFTYEARHRYTTTRVNKSNALSSDEEATSLNINSTDFFGKLTVAMNLSRQLTTRNVGFDVNVIDINSSISYLLVDNLVVSLSKGRQIQNYTDNIKENSSTFGLGLNWSLSEATKLAMKVDKNSLGKMYNLSFEHRTPRTSWRLSDVKNVSLANNKTSSGVQNNFDLLFSQFSSIEPDVDKRTQLVNSYMLLNGISSNSEAVNGYLTSGTSIQISKNVSFAILGIRDTVMFTATRSDGRRVGQTSPSSGDFNNSSSIHQDGFSISYSHRLTENTVLSNHFSKQNSRGDSTSQGSKIKSINITASTRISPKANLSIGIKKAISSGISFPYKEMSVTGGLTVQF